uniref:PH domain-containing protein n=1 Tax=Trichogramma kaykai TaxID=54128 RepID=A0ABD2WVL6_9HYME
MLQAVRLLTEMARTSDDRSRGETAAQSSTSSLEAPVLFREIHKNGWLRRTDTKSERESSRCWAAFCVHDDADPRIEGFIDQKQANTHSSVWSQSLRNALHLSPTLCATSKNDYEFCINFSDDRIMRLAAPTYQAMLDWVQVITRKLTDMKVLKPKENVYSKGPERIATRDPTSPLPPPPPNLAMRSQETGATSNAPAIFTFDDVFIIEALPQRRASFRQPSRSAPAVPRASTVTGTSTSAASSNDTVNNSGYESVFLASSSHTMNGESHSRSRSNGAVGLSRSRSSSDEGEQYAALIECRSRSDSNPEASTSFATSSSTSLSSSSSRSINPSRLQPQQQQQQQQQIARAQLTLREHQVMQLRKEMGHPAGVRLKLGRRDCKDAIAFVDCFGAVWIAGWKHKDHPLLYNVLHIGDLVLSIAGVTLTGASSIREILKNYTFPRVKMIVRRLPHGRVTTLTRRSEEENFGLDLNGSNEVVSVSPTAQALVLSARANPADPSADVGATVSWTLTEVNNKPLNLYEPSASDRLNGGVGRDVSVVLQPSDLMNGLKKKLRSVRGWKNFVMP